MIIILQLAFVDDLDELLTASGWIGNVKLKDKIITTKEESDEFTKSLELAAEKIERQLYKRKDKVKDKKHIKDRIKEAE